MKTCRLIAAAVVCLSTSAFAHDDFQPLYEDAVESFLDGATQDEIDSLAADAVAEFDPSPEDKTAELVYRSVIDITADEFSEGYSVWLSFVRQGADYAQINSDSSTPIYNAAGTMITVATGLLATDLSDDAVLAYYQAHCDEVLQGWLSSTETGYDLRADMLTFLDENPDLQEQFVLSTLIPSEDDNLNLVLGDYNPITVESITLENVGTDENEWWMLVIRITCQIESEVIAELSWVS